LLDSLLQEMLLKCVCSLVLCILPALASQQGRVKRAGKSLLDLALEDSDEDFSKEIDEIDENMRNLTQTYQNEMVQLENGIKNKIDIQTDMFKEMYKNLTADLDHIKVLAGRPECAAYKIFDDETRFINYDGKKTYCDNTGYLKQSPDWYGEGWYKFAAGKILPSKPPGKGKCGTVKPGWLFMSGVPSRAGDTAVIDVCFDEVTFVKDFCSLKYQGRVTNCGDYLVYFLPQAPRCNYRYCAVDKQ